MKLQRWEIETVAFILLFLAAIACCGCSQAAFTGGGGGVEARGQGLDVGFDKIPQVPLVYTVPADGKFDARGALAVVRSGSTATVFVRQEPIVRQHYIVTPEAHRGDTISAVRGLSWVPESPGAQVIAAVNKKQTVTMANLPKVKLTEDGIRAGETEQGASEEVGSTLSKWWSSIKQWFSGWTMVLLIGAVAFLVLPLLFPQVALFGKLKEIVVRIFTAIFDLIHRFVDWIISIVTPAPKEPPKT